MKENLFIRFLYNTILGRSVLKFLVNPNISRASARFLSSSASRCLVPIFVYKNKIDMSQYVIPYEGYKSFNDFFVRIKKEEYMPNINRELIAPCDGLLTVAAISEDCVFRIKHTVYSLGELLQDEELAGDYQGGTALIFRLTPAHYHRYIWCTTGFTYDERLVQGKLHSVRPICHEKVKVFVQNTREYVIINSASIGSVIQMEIGALLVGKITNHNRQRSQMIIAGQEKGYFEYGGSSIVIITEKKIELAHSISNRCRVSDEIPIMLGEKLI